MAALVLTLCFVLCFASFSVVNASVKYPDKNVLEKIAARIPKGATLFEDEDTPKDVECDICQIIVRYLQLWIEEGRTESDIVDLITRVCIDLKLSSERICKMVTREFKDEVFGVLDQIVLSPDEVCGVVIGPSCGTPYNPFSWWNVSLPSTPKPPVNPPTPPASTAPRLRFLHLTDIHIDLLYEVASNAECGEPLCCRSNDGKPNPGDVGAGKWGDYRKCDIYINLVDALFQHLTTIQDQFDFVIFTGDIPAHDVWNQTRTQQIAATRRLTKNFQQYLPSKMVYFCVGNHESAPVNSFPPPEVVGYNSISWLYTVLADSWGTWLPADTKATIRKGGYYSVSPYPGLRVLSVNNNYCNKGNFWLLINRTDPADQLQWLVQELQKAEDKAEKVYILAHIPPGKGNCLKPWSWNYYRIVNRYESTIAAHFLGHSHKDQYEVFYDDVTFSRPTSIGYVMGGVTTRGDLNPSYRIYTIDGSYKNSSWAVLDFETYYLDVEKANQSPGTPVWELEYTAKSEYNMTGLYPKDWNDLIYRMKNDDSLFQKFHKYFYKLRDNGACTGHCKRKLLCELKSARSHDPSLCNDL